MKSRSSARKIILCLRLLSYGFETSYLFLFSGFSQAEPFQDAGALQPATLSGIVRKSARIYLLTDIQSNVTVQVSGGGVEKYVHHFVTITGIPERSSAAGASQILNVLTIVDRGKGAPASRTIRPLPWPPASPSAWLVLPPVLPRAKTFGDFSGELDRVLANTGYFESSYYSVPRGLAIITRLEKIRPDGRPFAGQERWSQNEGYLQDLSAMSYISALFTAKRGHYRVVFFVITDQPFAPDGTKLTPEEATRLLLDGFNSLPADISGRQLPASARCTILIYEFEKPRGQEPIQIIPSSLSAEAHLKGSGLWVQLHLHD